MNKSHRDYIKLAALPDLQTKVSSLEIASSIIWTVKPQASWRHYTLRNQDGAGSCVGNGTAKALETMDKIVYSAHPIYSRRSNTPAEGMVLSDAGTIIFNQGTTTEALDPSNNLNEAQMDAPVTVPTPKKIKGYGFLVVTDLDAIATAIDTYGGVPITVDVAWDEWNTEQGIPTYISGAVVSGGHCLCAVDYTMYNGEKALVVENSWGNDDDSIGQTGQVIFTQSFLNGRGTGAMYMVSVPQTTWPYKYFQPSEVVNLQPSLIQMLDNARGFAGIPFVITSGFRNPAQNASVGGVSNSAHLTGNAADILCTDQNRWTIIQGGLQAGFKRVEACATHVHFDNDNDSQHPSPWFGVSVNE